MVSLLRFQQALYSIAIKTVSFFSFFNYKNNTFGISRIDSKFDVAPVLTFEASDAVIKGIRVGALKSVLYDGVYSIFSTMKLFWEKNCF